MSQHLTCDALIVHNAPGLLPKPSGIMLRLDGSAPETWVQHVTPWLRQHIKYSQQTLGLAMGGEPTPQERELIELIRNHYFRASVQQKTVLSSAAAWGRNFCETVKRSPRWATSLNEPLKGRPAFIVSAGPSLDRSGPLLADCQKRGPIIAVNSSGPACLHYGVVPDLVLCSEAIPVPDRLEPMRELGVQICLDAVASPLNWDASGEAWAYSWTEPGTVPYVLQLGALPLNYTGSVSCAAVALAILWGADPVILIGQDCAYTDGRMYGAGTPYASLQADVQDGYVSLSGPIEGTDRHAIQTIERVAWGGQGTVQTSHDFAVFIDWFSTTAAQHHIINATGGGARIEFAHELPLSRALADLPERERTPLPTPEPADTADVRRDLVSEARKLLSGSDISPPSTFPLLNMWAVGAIFGSQGLSPRQRRDRVREAMEFGAREVLEVLA